MALKMFFGVVLTMYFCSCNQQNKNNPQDTITTPKITDTVQEKQLPGMDEIKGKNFTEVRQLLGKPQWEEEFYFGEAVLGEFRVNLLNFFNHKDSTDRQKMIKEVTWPYGKEEGQNKNITVWFVKEGQQWIFVDQDAYPEGAEF